MHWAPKNMDFQSIFTHVNKVLYLTITKFASQ